MYGVVAREAIDIVKENESAYAPLWRFADIPECQGLGMQISRIFSAMRLQTLSSYAVSFVDSGEIHQGPKIDSEYFNGPWFWSGDWRRQR